MHEQLKINLKSLVVEALSNDGLSVQVFTGKRPTSGYMVSVYPERELIVRNLSDVVLGEYIHDNINKLRMAANHLGIWVDDKAIHLNISINLNLLGASMSAAKYHNQQAIYDVVKGRDITTGL